MEIGDKITILKTTKNYKAGDIAVVVSLYPNYLYKHLDSFLCEVLKTKYQVFFFTKRESALFKKIKDKKKIG